MFRSFFLIFVLASGAALGKCPASPAADAGECLRNEIQKAERRLEGAYKILAPQSAINDLDEKGLVEGKRLLTSAHKAWFGYRKNQCAFEGFQQGGVAIYKAVVEYQCVLRMTNARIDEYKRLTGS
jgi:uncharacterized protein YecT (DUF1311 family)